MAGRPATVDLAPSEARRVRAFFEALIRRHGNRRLASAATGIPAGTIGQYGTGQLRCVVSEPVLRAIAGHLGATVEDVIAGRAALAERAEEGAAR